MTIYSAQGLTVDRAIVIGGSGLSANQAYVMTSRARDRTDIVINANEIDAELRAQARTVGAPLTAASGKQDRLGQVARSWAHREAKENATEALWLATITATKTHEREPEA